MPPADVVAVLAGRVAIRLIRTGLRRAIAIGAAWSGLLSNFALAVRPFCHNEHYWLVYFHANRAIAQTLLPMSAAGIDGSIMG